MYRKLNLLILFVFLSILYPHLLDCSEFTEKYDKLRFLRHITLQENDTTIISQITNVSTNSNSSKILISDAKGKILILYDSHNGNIIRTFECGLNYSDSLAIKGKYWNDEYKYITKDKVRDKSGKPLNEDYLKARLVNEIIDGFFLNDQEIWASAHIRCFGVPKDTNQKDKGIIIGLATALIKFNTENENVFFLPLEQKFFAFPQGYSFAFDKNRNKIIIMTKNYPAQWNNNYDSLWILGSYSLDGKLQELIAKMPEEYTTTKLGYQMLHEPKCCFNEANELLCIYPYAERVFNLTKGTHFKLQSLPHTNKVYLDSLISEPNLLSKFLERYPYFLPITIKNIFTKKNNDIVITLMHVFKYDDTTMIRERIIQEYSPEGRLIRQYKFDNIDGDSYIDFIYYDKNKDEYLIFKNSKSQGWSIDFYISED